MTTFTTQDRQDAQRTPLTFTDIELIVEPFIMTQFITGQPIPRFNYIEFARAIERAHGIGE